MAKDKFKLQVSRLFMRNRSDREKYLLAYIGALIDERDEAVKYSDEMAELKERADELYRDNQVMAGATQERSDRIISLEGQIERKNLEIEKLKNNISFVNDQIDGYKLASDESERKYKELKSQFDNRVNDEVSHVKDINDNLIRDLNERHNQKLDKYGQTLLKVVSYEFDILITQINNRKGVFKKDDLLKSVMIKFESIEREFNKTVDDIIEEYADDDKVDIS